MSTKLKHTKQRGKSIVAPLTLAPTMLFIERPEDRFNAIDADLSLDDEKKHALKEGVLEEIEQRSAISDKDWAQYYATIEFLRQNEWFWKAKGFVTFDAYWQHYAGNSYQTWAELEAIYNFAKIANPSMFDLTREDAIALIKELSSMRSVDASISDLRRKRVFATASEALLRIKQAAHANINYGRGSLEKRFAKLWRTSHEVGARFVNGDYIEQNETGNYYIDISQAELDAKVEGTKPKRPSMKKSDSIIRMIESLKSDSELKIVIDYIKNLNKNTVAAAKS